VIGDVGRGHLVDVLSATRGQELTELCEVAAVAVECVRGQAALDLEVIEVHVDGLVEAEPARHGLIGR
jgi:hypothetical protein